MDDFNGEVSCTEVVGIAPSEQALTHGSPLAVLRREGGLLFFFPPFFFCSGSQSVFPPWSVLVHPGRAAATLQVDSSCVSLLTPPCNR